MKRLEDLSLDQLKFAQAGLRQSSNWEQLAKKLSFEDQLDCLGAMAMQKNPAERIMQLAVAKQFSMRRTR
ncbi:hypothetical protein [Limosilactobacillus fermentum]|uniref:hypothetical protein n=1 Tax=Limosilactobacillus fermentum TaxID=1613 RepID=UPI000E539820|nr:hypothetical protein [Limosilactobacillus fermentum]KAB1957610.1 hypothetical protein F8252_08525 [Limosilactobacillus fermentum]MCH5383241.1 hypothetical protein [Limosilactobacillus fermentum]RGU88029.1 hypothetical protein DWW42_04735 [Limosilactobacillus fermentum]